MEHREYIPTGIKEFKGTAQVTKGMVDQFGFITAGDMFKLLDLTAHACARRYCGQAVQTIQIDPLEFRKRVKLGDRLTMLATVNITGETSMEIGLKVINKPEGVDFEETIVTGFFSLVAIDDKGKPVKVLPLKPSNDSEEQRLELARLRRQARKEYSTKMTELNRLMSY